MTVGYGRFSDLIVLQSFIKLSQIVCQTQLIRENMAKKRQKYGFEWTRANTTQANVHLHTFFGHIFDLMSFRPNKFSASGTFRPYELLGFIKFQLFEFSFWKIRPDDFRPFVVIAKKTILNKSKNAIY